ncbi:DotA/TraY family protein [Aliagarivorans taiwanensis]|uniref:DotA/TraY family protein n=1 Tax=Aliagarivorans taiwanensis TaxID=561966 RepID=UPI00047C374A|nr:DotA/TraY family protein [Aliagarivorans taiwanensis]
MRKNAFKSVVLVFLLSILGPMHISAASDSPLVNIENGDFPQLPNEVTTTGSLAPDWEDMLGGYRSYTDAQLPLVAPSTEGFWHPESLFDGPHHTDLMYRTLRMLIGSPVDKAYSVFANAPGTEVQEGPVTLVTAMAIMLNTLGIIGMIAIVIISLLVFMLRSSAELDFLSSQPNQADPNLFAVARFAWSVLFSFPIPIFAGVNIFQMMTLTTVLLGLGMARAIIRIGIVLIITPGTLMYDMPSVSNVVDSLLDSKICVLREMEFNNIDKIDDSGAHFVVDTKHKTGFVPGDVSQTYIVETELQANFVDDQTCGSMMLGRIDNYKNNPISPEPKVGVVDGMRILIQRSLLNANQTAVFNLWKNLDPIADFLVQNDYEPDKADYNAKFETKLQEYEVIKQNYYYEVMHLIQQAVISATTSQYVVDIEMVDQLSADGGMTGVRVASFDTAFIDDIANVGLFGLGSTYMMLSRRQQTANTIISDFFHEASGGNAYRQTHTARLASKFLTWLMSFTSAEANATKALNYRHELFLNTHHERTNVARSLEESVRAMSDSSGFSGSVKSLVSMLSRFTAGAILGGVERMAGTSSNGDYFPDPITEMQTIGVMITNTALIMPLVKKALDKAFKNQQSKGEENEGDNSLGNNHLSRFIGSIMGAMMILGLMYSQLIPNLPYIVWSIAVMSYLHYVIVAYLGSGWWGMGITQGDRADLKGKSSQGVNILVSLFLRPPLMAISFFVAMMLNRALGFYVQMTLMPAIRSAYEGTFDLFQFFGILFVNGAVITIGIYKNLAITWELPTMLLQFIEVGDKHHNNLGAQEAIDASKGMMSGFAGNLGRASIPGKI